MVGYKVHTTSEGSFEKIQQFDYQKETSNSLTDSWVFTSKKFIICATCIIKSQMDIGTNAASILIYN